MNWFLRLSFVAIFLGCPKLQLYSHTLSSPQLYVYRFGAKVVVSCADGYSFHDSDSLHASQDIPSTGSLELECLEGGVWSVTELPSCKCKYYERSDDDERNASKQLCFPMGTCWRGNINLERLRYLLSTFVFLSLFSVLLICCCCLVVQCPPGSYRENGSQQCEECDKGQYQPSAGATSCQECPAGTTTEASGSRDAMECKRKHYINSWLLYCASYNVIILIIIMMIKPWLLDKFNKF